MKIQEVILIYCGVYWINLILSFTVWYSPIIFMAILTIGSLYMYYRSNIPDTTLSLEEQERDREFLERIRDFNKKKES